MTDEGKGIVPAIIANDFINLLSFFLDIWCYYTILLSSGTVWNSNVLFSALFVFIYRSYFIDEFNFWFLFINFYPYLYYFFFQFHCLFLVLSFLHLRINSQISSFLTNTCKIRTVFHGIAAAKPISIDMFHFYFFSVEGV